jgi:hypothetical protein
MSRFIFAICLLAAFLPAQMVTAQPEIDQTALTAACRQTVSDLMTALETGDAEALRLHIHTDRRIGAQMMGLGALIDCIVSQRELERAMVQRWGRDAVGRIAGPSIFTPADRAAVAAARVESQGDNEALLMLSTSVSPIVLHRNRFDNRWRVRLVMITSLYDGFERSPTPGSYKRISYLRAVATALQLARREVEDGKLTNPLATRAAVQKSIETTLSASPSRRSKNPNP